MFPLDEDNLQMTYNTVFSLFFFKFSGLTPQRRQITYPRDLTKTEEHDAILTDFRSAYKPTTIVMNLESQLATVDEKDNTPNVTEEQVNFLVNISD